MANLTFMNHAIFDHGASAQLGQVLMQHGIRRPLLCTDKGLVNLGMVTDLAANLGNDAALTIYDGTPENPTQVSVEEATAKYLEADCDGVVAFGGGSSMDLAKLRFRTGVLVALLIFILILILLFFFDDSR